MDGTPAEIVHAFEEFCLRSGEPLSASLFFRLVEQAPIALSITDESAKVLYANRTFERVTGYSRSQVIGKNESILSNRATPRSHYTELWNTIRKKRVWNGNLVNRKKNGDAYLAELTIMPVVDDRGRITHYLGMHRDVTRAYELQCQVEHQKGLLESILDTAPEVVALLDDEGRVLLDNQEYKKLFGDLRGAEPAEVLLEAVAEQTGSTGSMRGARQKDFRNREVRLEFSGSEPRWFSCSATWFEAPGPSAIDYFKPSKPQSLCLLLASETTRQRREHERARTEHLRASLAEEQRIRGIRETVAAAAFQIRQPLNLVNAATAMLRRTGEGSGELLQALEQIAVSAQRAYEVLRAALPAEDDEPQRSLNINELVQQVLELSSEKLLTAGVVVGWQPTTVLPTFLGRAKQVRGLLMDVVDNAIVALGESGTNQPELMIRTSESGGVLTITVEDTGPGVPRSDHLLVFQPLYCGWKRRSGHAGMGLAAAQEIATQHGGGIEIDGNFEQGCRVRIDLPVKR